MSFVIDPYQPVREHRRWEKAFERDQARRRESLNVASAGIGMGQSLSACLRQVIRFSIWRDRDEINAAKPSIPPGADVAGPRRIAVASDELVTVGSR